MSKTASAGSVLKMPESTEFGISSIEIEKFRKFKPMSINLGRYVTVIAGQNSTGKSTLLGMLGQPFGLRNEKSIFGKDLRAKFTDIFKLSPEKDIPGEHVYFVNLKDNELYGGESKVQVKSYPRKDYPKMPIRMVTGATRGKGDGNIDFPVIYLGLKRTYPIGEIPNVAATQAELSNEEAEQFAAWYSHVFMSWRQEIAPVQLEKNAANKATLLVNTPEYDYLANSAGQDNLGQILGSLISFERLRNKLGDAYHGGLLLIDELDATLFPASQEALFDLFLAVAKNLKIQVIFTTHSLSLLEKAISVRGNGDVEVVYLRRRSQGIELLPKPTMDDVRADLNVRPQLGASSVKVEVWCEDGESAWFLRHILSRSIKTKCNIVEAGLSCGELGELSIRNLPSLENVLFVVDGDALRSASKKIKDSQRLCVLPTGDRNPERAIFEDLLALDDDGIFWTMSEAKNGYSRQMFERSFEECHGGIAPSAADRKRKQRLADKAWLKKEKAAKHWGENGVDVISQWKQLHESDLLDFSVRFEAQVDRVIRRVQAMARRSQER